jgi:hypothetical protein
MADEALAGLDEGALRKLVISSSITVLWGGQPRDVGHFLCTSQYIRRGRGLEERLREQRQVGSIWLLQRLLWHVPVHVRC